MKIQYISLILLLFLGANIQAQFTDKSSEYQKFKGFFDFYYDDTKDRIFLEVNTLEEEFLYVYSLSSGIGSNDIGLDRGQLGNEQVVYFKKAGAKLLLVQPNLRFRALTDNNLEKQSVEQAFAKSVLFGFPIIEENKGTYYIDITDFLMQDSHRVAGRLKRAKQGSYSLDKSKSAFDFNRTKAFPNNLEFDAILTFKGEAQGNYIRSVTPNPNLVTVSQHHSFIELPDSDYAPRQFDPRCGSYPFSYYDYATPVEEPILKRFVTRHRLEKKDPTAEVSEAVEPIIYYLDNGTPEPVRTALLEGGSWWNQAYEAIGYKDAFQVKILPDDADPLDVRYNVIQWVHRSTRGWSYGSSVTDPRTGEIIKGHVSLGSLRIRQDFLIAQALMNKPFADRDDNHQAMLDVALARIRQLSAHEIGHTLGFAHNFAASTNNRASVMDYPHPLVSLVNGKLDFNEAYDTGIGDWDKVSVAYSYSDLGEAADERTALNDILETAFQKGLRYISDQDARPQGGSNAMAHLWDNGTIPSRELTRVLDVRAKAISQFSIDNIRTDEPHAVLEDVFVPIYFFHRYQTEAAVKLVGGQNYTYAIKGSKSPVMSTLSKESQLDALDQVLKTIDPGTLMIPENVLNLFPPRAMGYPRTRESFKGVTGVTFDAISAAETAADFSLSLLLHPQRASRLVQNKAMDKGQLGLDEVLDLVIDASVNKSGGSGYEETVRNAVNFRVVHHLMNLAAHGQVYDEVNAIAAAQLLSIKKQILTKKPLPVHTELVRRIDAFFEDMDEFKTTPVAKIPDGSPIGMSCMNP
ncbi:MAG: DUF5117 domain-containing protein [Eudoraea sp.]|nr:DUF5117 domain-containing protein [Eudoraea sp.]